MEKYFVIKKNPGYVIKRFNEIELAKEYAESCCKANHNDNFAVFERKEGFYVEI